MQEHFKSSVPKIKALRFVFMVRYILSVSLIASNVLDIAVPHWPPWGMAQAPVPTHSFLQPLCLPGERCCCPSTKTLKFFSDASRQT